jgi:molybdate transport system substrate-binding protein
MMRTAAAYILPLALLALVLHLAGCSSSTDPTPASGGRGRLVRVAAAADLKYAFDDLKQAFERSYPEIQVEVTYGSSGNFFAQLENRAPFDLFLSADMDYPRRLTAQGLALPDSQFQYAVGHLVVWVPQSSPLDLAKLGIQALLDPSVRKIAIANPRFAPYGRAAEAALKSLGVYDRVQDRLVLGDNVGQTAQFIQTGAADIGLISQAQALAPALRAEGRFWEVPRDAYPRLEQGGIILSWVKDRDAAESLRAFVTGADGTAILERYGFAQRGD